MEPAVGAKDAMINLKDVIEIEKAEVLNADPKTSIKVSHLSPSPSPIHGCSTLRSHLLLPFPSPPVLPLSPPSLC